MATLTELIRQEDPKRPYTDEQLAQMLQLRGVRPFLSDKYDITKHPNYRYLSDADPKNAFDIEKFLSAKLKLKPEEEFEVFDAGAAAGSESA